MHRLFRLADTAAALLIATAVVLAAEFEPARRVSGALPSIPIAAIGWTEAQLDVGIDVNGRVSGVTGLRATPGALASITAVVEGWRFQTAKSAARPVASAVRVDVLIRPPQLYDTAPGSPAVDLAAPSEGIPSPIIEQRPRYPPDALTDGLALVEVLVGSDGRVERATLVQADAGFGSAALEAARGWMFRPARYQDQPVTSYVYLVFGFRSPVTVAPPAPGE